MKPNTKWHSINVSSYYPKDIIRGKSIICEQRGYNRALSLRDQALNRNRLKNKDLIGSINEASRHVNKLMSECKEFC